MLDKHLLVSNMLSSENKDIIIIIINNIIIIIIILNKYPKYDINPWNSILDIK